MPGRALALNLVKDSKSIQLIVTGGGIEIMRFSEFYGPERQRELLSEAENERLVRAGTANGQSRLISLKGDNMMYRKIAIALIVVGSLVIGYTSFIGSTAQASHNCSSDSTVLAANPELNVACQNDVIAGNESAALRAVEASAARYSAMAENYLAQNETNVQRAFEADAARYTAMAAYYLAQNETNVQRANDANAARYSGLAAYLTANPDKLGWFN
jgi:hypothetical protein